MFLFSSVFNFLYYEKLHSPLPFWEGHYFFLRGDASLASRRDRKRGVALWIYKTFFGTFSSLLVGKGMDGTDVPDGKI